MTFMVASGWSQVGVSPTPSQLRFEVVSVRPHRWNGDEPSNRRVLPGGRFVATATTARTLIRIATLSDDDHMSGAPGWIDHDLFDITATTANHAEINTPEAFQQAVRSLLEDRYGFKFHREQKEGSVYWLETVRSAKLGLGLTRSAPNTSLNVSTNSNGTRKAMAVSKASMADVAAALGRQVGRPVEDHTGLQGTFDFKIEWSPDETPDSVYPSLFTVLKEQLGLRLRADKGRVETVVIDAISRPSDN